MTVSLGDYTADFARSKGGISRKRALQVAGGAGAALAAGGVYLATKGKGARAMQLAGGSIRTGPAALPAYSGKLGKNPWDSVPAQGRSKA